jgi:alkanesulfonate monooxygenase SsuD/methylene tetrahydromethanopterin reductase-like flavin-dependent oxidoreductase (luciferase family)
MHYGFTIPGPGGNPRLMAELAVLAEAAGWDGVFFPDCICIPPALDPNVGGEDPWVVLAAMAMRTERIKLGTVITPLSRRRPWKLARETTTLDHLSGGRLILSVGLGALDDLGFAGVGEATDRKTRAELLDEGLEILTGLWSGQPFRFDGKHYHVDEVTFLPRPVQQPRIPIWVVGAWLRPKSMERVLRYDGLLPNWGEVTPDDIRAMRAYIAERRSATTPFDVVFEGETPGDDPARAAEIVGRYADAGLTWWLESMWSPRVEREGWASMEEAVRTRIRQGPPRGA